MTRVHLKLLGPCYKTGRMGHRLDTECETAQPPARARTTKTECMHHANAARTHASSREFTSLLRLAATALRLPGFPAEAGPLRSLRTTQPADSAHSVPKCIWTWGDHRRGGLCRTPSATSPHAQTEWTLDTSTPSASTITVSRSLALSFQSAFQLSFTVLVCYRSRSRI